MQEKCRLYSESDQYDQKHSDNENVNNAKFGQESGFPFVFKCLLY